MKSRKVSILTVTYNNERQIDKLLKSILSSDIKDEIEVLIWDNSSKDKTKDRVLKYKDKVKYTFSPNNLGFGRAVNKLIGQSKGEAILLLNPDCVVSKNTIRKLYDKSIELGEKVVVCPKLINPNGKPQASIFRFPTILNAIKKYFLQKANSYGKYWPGNKETYVDVAVMAAMLIPRQIFNEIGLLDERFFLYYEDIEFCERLKRNGYSVLYYPSVKVVHEHGASGKFVSHHDSPLLKSSYIYHGRLYAHMLHLVLRLGQIWEKRILRK